MITEIPKRFPGMRTRPEVGAWYFLRQSPHLRALAELHITWARDKDEAAKTLLQALRVEGIRLSDPVTGLPWPQPRMPLSKTAIRAALRGMRGSI